MSRSAHARTSASQEPELPDPSRWPEVRDELKRLRLAMDLSYERMGEEIERLVPGTPMPGVTLRKLLADEQTTPLERTLYRLVNALPGLRAMRDERLAKAAGR